MSDTLSGKKIGKYLIKEKLGSGGMAEVYKGYQENLDRFVAIKLMHAFLISDQDFLNRFQREARAMAALNHPNIVGVYDFDVYGENSYYLVMEYIRGGTLKDRLEALARQGERLALKDVIKMMAEIADALAYAHRREMVHRDIKPANIMLNEDTGRAVLTDFGIVKLMGNQSMAYTATGALIGTPAYMAPEQALGQSGDHRVDIYSLGVMLFQMVTGILPFDADTPLAVVMKHVNTPTPLPDSIIPDIPWGLQEVILKAMAKSPEERYQSAGEFAAALRAVDLTATANKPAGVVPPPAKSLDQPTPAQTEVMKPEPETAVSPPTPQTKKRPAWLFPVIGVVVLAVIGAILAASGVFSNNPDPTATVPAVAEVEDTETPTSTVPAEPTNTQAPDVAATNFAQLVIDLTREAQPTETPTPSRTPTVTPTSTPTTNATAMFLTNCEPGVELVSASRSGFVSNAITTQFSFTAAWVLRNSGTCPWSPEFSWQYVNGETFDYDGDPIPLEETVMAGDEITLTAPFRAPNTPGTYESTWQLINEDGEPFGDPVEFEFRAFLPATNTPVPTATTAAPPTADADTDTDGQVAWTPGLISNCEYIGMDWRCQLTIQPYIEGSNQTGRYTVFVFDLPGGQAVTYRGQGPFFHFIIARRCAAYNQSLRIIDDVTGTELTANVYVDPNNFFPGGCTEP